MPTAQPPNRAGRLSRDRLTTFALLALTGVTIALAVVVAAPFIPALTWALAFAVVAYPSHKWIARRIRRPQVAAGLSVFVFVLILLLPSSFLVWQIGREVGETADTVQRQLESGEFARRAEQNPILARMSRWAGGVFDIEEQGRQLAQRVAERAGRWIQATAWGIAQIVIALFALFYFLRDREAVLQQVRSLMPLSDRETDEFFDQIYSITYATIYGTVVVAFIQGALGGLMFVFLGIPAALLWGVAMALLALIPMLGAFVIWLPVAVVLAMQGAWGKALLLGVWGTLVVGTIDNVLYPMLVGKEMRLHTLPVFIAIVGGLAVFGGAGIVLGPIILATTIAMLGILRRRTAAGRSAEQGS